MRRVLMVPASDLSRWIAGAEEMPKAVFLKATDVLVEITQSQFRRSQQPSDPDGTIPDRSASS